MDPSTTSLTMPNRNESVLCPRSARQRATPSSKPNTRAAIAGAIRSGNSGDAQAAR